MAYLDLFPFLSELKRWNHGRETQHGCVSGSFWFQILCPITKFAADLHMCLAEPTRNRPPGGHFWCTNVSTKYSPFNVVSSTSWFKSSWPRKSWKPQCVSNLRPPAVSVLAGSIRVVVSIHSRHGYFQGAQTASTSLPLWGMNTHTAGAGWGIRETSLLC